jgi:hypothetical protein
MEAALPLASGRRVIIDTDPVSDFCCCSCCDHPYGLAALSRALPRAFEGLLFGQTSNLGHALDEAHSDCSQGFWRREKILILC